MYKLQKFLLCKNVKAHYIPEIHLQYCICSLFLYFRDDRVVTFCMHRCEIRSGSKQCSSANSCNRRAQKALPTISLTLSLAACLQLDREFPNTDLRARGPVFNRYGGRDACLSFETYSDDGWKRRHCVEGRSIAATESSVFLSLWARVWDVSWLLAE